MNAKSKTIFTQRRLPAAVLSALLAGASGHILAGPTGGQVVGGSGSISQSGATTSINQSTQNMAINWQSYNVNVDERVQYIQPNSSSVSLNRILSNNGSTIAGRIDANGQVILVNPNGIFFTPTSVVNVGGIIASGLDITPTDFMNGNYIFNEVLNTDGTVINSGTINASLGGQGGGNVALIGKQVENNGLIVANLGSVNLAAGKQAVLTFDNGGLLGVRVSEEILQDELGVDPAVMNSGEIQAEGGRVLLTASTSQDVFSQAVNTNGLDQAISVVVHEDGSFTLGGGADVVNSGSIDTSTSSNDQSVGRIVLLGESVTSSGELHADAANGSGGEVELHAQDKTLLTEDSVTSARSEANGQGGIVKVLGDKVGLFDQATVDVSGANGGGRALIGGDYQGKNANIRNASRTTIAPETKIYADAISQGDGGKVIVWADDYTRFYGNLFARGGSTGGNGGFAEVSGKEKLQYSGFADLTASFGQTGTLLLDPRFIRINNSDTEASFPDRYDDFDDGSDTSDYDLNADILSTQLNGANVELQANTDILIEDDISISATVAATGSRGRLRLYAGRSIEMGDNAAITLLGGNFEAVINHQNAETVNREAGNAVFSMGAGSSITTNGGAISITTGTFTGNNIGDITLQTLNTSIPGAINGAAYTGGEITVTNSTGDILANGGVSANGEGWDTIPGDIYGGTGGAIGFTANAGAITLASTGSITSNGGNAGTGGSGNNNGGSGGPISLGAQNIFINGAINSNGGNRNGGGENGSGGEITLTVSGDLAIEADISSVKGTSGASGSDGSIAFNGDNNDNTFTINNNPVFSATTVTVNGLDGNDRLVRGGTATANTWTIFDFGSGVNGTNDGTLAFGSNTGSDAIRFVDIPNLTGNTLVDSFVLEASGNLTGLITGGDSLPATVIDTLTINRDNTAVQLHDPSGSLGNVASRLNVTAIETITDATNNTTFANVIYADNTANSWDFAAGGVTVGPTTDATADNTVTLISYSEFNGGAGVDTANFSTSFANTFNGGAGVDYIYLNTGAVIDGTVNGEAGADRFNITADVTGAGSLNGGTGDDQFNLAADFTGTINGDEGSDIFNINATGLTLTLVGGTETDTVRGPDSANFWIVDSAGGGTLDQTAIADATVVNFSGMETLTGGTGTGVDTFTVNPGASIGTLSGLGGNDAFTVNGAVTTVNGGDGADDIGITGTAGSVAAGAGDDMIMIVNAASVTGLIDGEDGTDTLTVTGDGVAIALGTDADRIENLDATGTGPHTLTGSDAAANTWDISASGNSVDDGTTSTTFTGFSVLNAGSAGDDFTVNVAGISTINGSDPGNDAITLATAGLVATVNGGDNGTADNDSLTILDGTNTWSVDASDNGSVTITGSTPPEDTTTFTSIETRIASSDGNDSIDLSDVPLVLLENYQNFGTLRGNNTGTLQGTNNQNDWYVEDFDGAGSLSDGVNDGRVLVGTITTQFIDFLNLTGGDGIDNFTIAETGSITGTISGGSGIGVNTLTGRNAGSTWTITANNTGFIDTAEVTPARYVQEFSAIQEINGSDGNDTFAFNIDPAGTGMTINGGADPGFDTADLSGLADITVSLANFPGMERIIGTNDGSNANSSMLIGANDQINTWRIEDVDGAVSTVADGVNDGSLNGTEFINFNLLVGGNATDNFVVAVGGTLPNGLINGMGGGNTIDIQNTAIGIVEIGDRINSSFNIFQIGDVTGNGTTQLLSDSAIATNNWAISNTNIGTINQGTPNEVVFTNFDQLFGNSTNDNFYLHDVIVFSGTIDGGTGNNQLIAGNRAINTWSITGTSTGTVTGLSGQFSNIQTLTGNAGQDIFQLHDSANFAGSINGAGGAGDTLYAGNRATNDWSVTGAASGTVTGLTGNFSDIESLVGGNGQDIFRLHDVATFAGSIDGNGGSNDQLHGGDRPNTWAITAANNTGMVTGLSGTFSNVEALIGNDDIDVFNLHASIDFDGSFDGAGGNNDEVIGGNRPTNIWTITDNNNTGTVTGISGNFSNVEQLTGNDGQDNFELHASVNFDGNIDGGLGTNTLTGGARTNDWVIDGTNGNTVTGLTAGNTFTNIQNLSGSGGIFNDSFIFVNGGSIAGLISGGPQAIGGEDVVDMSGLNTDITVRIGTGQDIVGIERVIGNNNGIGTDPDSTLVGENNLNNWTISGTNSGSVDGVNFEDFNILMGNSGDDVFTFTADGNITGLIDGGAPNLTPWAPGDNWDSWEPGMPADRVYMNALASVDLEIGVDIVNIELVVGSDTGNSILRAAPGTNNWNITGTNTGIVNGTEFRQFDDLRGNAQEDAFYVNNGGSIGTIRGGAGNDLFVVQTGGIVGSIYGEAGNDSFDTQGTVGFIDGGADTDSIIYREVDVIVTVGDDLAGFEGVIAENGGTINARNNTATTWNITGNGAGDVSDTGIAGPPALAAENLTFAGFTNINGGSGVDEFNVSGNGSVPGLISGNGGADELSINLAGRTQTGGRISYDGGGDAGDIITVIGPANLYTETYQPNQAVAGLAGSFDQLDYVSPSAGLELNFRAVEAVTDDIVVTTLTLNSVNVDNTLRLGTNTFGATNSASVLVAYEADSKNNIAILAQNGADVSIEGDVSLPGTLSVTADSLTITAGSGITASTLELDGISTVGTETERLNTTVANLQVNNSGPAYLNETDGLNITQLNTSNLLDIQAGGDVTSTAALSSSGALNIQAGGDITLSGANQLSGPISLSEGNANAANNNNTFTLNNAVPTNLAGISVQNLTINSGGAVTDSGEIMVTGAATLSSPADVILDSASNNFNVLTVNSGGMAEFNDVDNIIGGSITAASVQLNTATGVGAESARLQTSTADLTINNTTGGGVYVQNSQNVQADIVNMGDIHLQNNGNVAIARLYTNGGNYGAGQTQYTGDVRLVTQGNFVGAYTGTGAHDQYSAPDVVAENFHVETFPSDLGTTGRPVSIRVNENFTFIGAQGYVYYYGARPRTVIGAADLVEFTGIGGLTGQQLIEIESLGDVDEAIFTEVRNYYHEDVAIMLPADQRMTDDEDENERKRREAVN